MTSGTSGSRWAAGGMSSRRLQQENADLALLLGEATDALEDLSPRFAGGEPRARSGRSGHRRRRQDESRARARRAGAGAGGGRSSRSVSSGRSGRSRNWSRSHSPRARRSARRSSRGHSPARAVSAAPARLEVVGLGGFEEETGGRYTLSYRREHRALQSTPERVSIMYERDEPAPPAALVYEDGAWSIRQTADAAHAFVLAEDASRAGANPASLNTWEMPCPGKKPHPWIRVPDSFRVSELPEDYSDSVSEGDYSDGYSYSDEEQLSRLGDREFSREIAQRRYRRHTGRAVGGGGGRGRRVGDGGLVRGSRSPRRATSRERTSRLASRPTTASSSRSVRFGDSPTQRVIERSSHIGEPVTVNSAATGAGSSWLGGLDSSALVSCCAVDPAVGSSRSPRGWDDRRSVVTRVGQAHPGIDLPIDSGVQWRTRGSSPQRAPLNNQPRIRGGPHLSRDPVLLPRDCLVEPDDYSFLSPSGHTRTVTVVSNTQPPLAATRFPWKFL